MPDSPSLSRELSSDLYRVTEDGCWIWQGRLNGAGYGMSGPGLWKLHPLAHRAVYAAHGRILLAGMHLHHTCENKACVNPDHLEALDEVQHRTLHGQQDSHLTWEIVREIRAARAAGASLEELMERFPVTRTDAHYIVNNERWHDPNYTPGRVTDCEWCGETFVARRSHQRFCCPEHRVIWNSRHSYRVPRGLDPRFEGDYRQRRAA